VTDIAVIDHGAGNLVSMAQALRRVGAVPHLVESREDLDRYDGVILPGVGATGSAMTTLVSRGLIGPIRSYQGPLLGVCVGLQLLFDHSDEDDNRCLGLIDGEVKRLPVRTLPHMGWNDVSHESESLLADVPQPATFYFVHSYAVEPADPSIVTGTTTVDGTSFASVVRSGAVAGVQFHPERSGAQGLSVLGAFVAECSGVRRVA
jgi:glutamine amidotransferase